MQGFPRHVCLKTWNPNSDKLALYKLGSAFKTVLFYFSLFLGKPVGVKEGIPLPAD